MKNKKKLRQKQEEAEAKARGELQSESESSSDDEEEEEEYEKPAPKKQQAKKRKAAAAAEESDDDEDEDDDAIEDNRDKPRPKVEFTGINSKEKCVILSSRGVTSRYRHLMLDIGTLIPHSKKDSKLAGAVYCIHIRFFLAQLEDERDETDESRLDFGVNGRGPARRTPRTRETRSWRWRI